MDRTCSADECEGNVFQLDLKSGQYTLLSGNTPDWGPRMWMPQDMFVVVPEPGGVVMIVSTILAIHYSWRRQLLFG